jgi:hypothetical protein
MRAEDVAATVRCIVSAGGAPICGPRRAEQHRGGACRRLVAEPPRPRASRRSDARPIGRGR